MTIREGMQLTEYLEFLRDSAIRIARMETTAMEEKLIADRLTGREVRTFRKHLSGEFRMLRSDILMWTLNGDPQGLIRLRRGVR